MMKLLYFDFQYLELKISAIGCNSHRNLIPYNPQTRTSICPRKNIRLR